MDIWYSVSEFLRIVWEGVTWFFGAEERLAILMAEYEVPYLRQIGILTVVNCILIICEFGFVHLAWTSSEWVKNLKTPNFLKRVAHDKPITLGDLFLFAFMPVGTQKIGVVAFHAKREQFGFKGFAALVLGGFIRVSLYPFAGSWLWTLIIGMIIIRLWLWWGRDFVHWVRTMEV